ncbi:hypothetical protein [Pandoraea sputorum]|uniref:hypothetical protein n=1 Tax=Pandoraea sputorum TaxID=93222 RepID=UPI00124086C3|nr:hypothetical protein [Pandoraea sputorum]VVE77391.1 hypothetical protein PSP31120_01268 [Pandoraea sputorum]
MSQQLLQPSFSGGEISPSLYGRVDQQRYGTSLRTCRNWIVQKSGGVSNRPGTRFICTTKGNAPARLVDFQFSDDQTYVLIFTAGALQFVSNGAQVMLTGTAPLEIASPYTQAELSTIKWTQSADVMTIVHPNHPPYQLKRHSALDWTLLPATFDNGPFLDDNADKTIKMYASGSTGTVTVTSSADVFNANHVGALIRLEIEDWSTIVPWEPAQVLAGIGVNTLNMVRSNDGKIYYCATDYVPSQGNVATGTVAPVHDSGTYMDGPFQAVENLYERKGVAWRYDNSGYGIGRIVGYTDARNVLVTVLSKFPTWVTTTSYQTSIWALGAWSVDQGYPSAVTYYGDRQAFANTNGRPQTLWMSKVSDYQNFGESTPIVDDDSITATLNTRKVTEIRDLVGLASLVALTSSAEWRASGGQNNVLTPSTISFTPQSYTGTADIPAKIVGNTAVYVQNRGHSVRDLAYSLQDDGYIGNDLAIFSDHLFTSAIVDIDFQLEPFSVVWCVRADGVLLGMTYLKEQQVVGWHWHDTDGSVEAVRIVPEGDEDVLYIVVNRTIGGVTKRYIERMNTRKITSIEQSFFVDAGLSYDGTNKDTGKTVTVTGAAWDSDETFTLSASGFVFAFSDVGNAIHVTAGGQTVRFTIMEFVSTSQVRANASAPVPTAMQAIALSTYGFARLTFSGLDHLEGKEVSVLGDGGVQGAVTVSGGKVTIDEPAVIVHIGLPYVSDFETLDITLVNGAPVRSLNKMIPSVSVLLQESRGLMAGPSFDKLYEYKPREFEDMGAPPELKSGIATVPIETDWEDSSRVCIRQSDPLPITIIGVLPEVTLGGR